MNNGMKLKYIDCGATYSIRGEIIKCVRTTTLHQGVKIHYFEGAGKRYSCAQWQDGTIYRVREIAK